MWTHGRGSSRLRRGKKSRAKDSVFGDLFSIPRYQLQLIQELHPAEEFDEAEIKLVTLEHVLMNGEYNDLGLMVRNRLLLLAESQSTWSLNILPRFIPYLASTYKEYYEENDISLYRSKKVDLPRPELYVIYTGKGHKPKEISLTESFFDGQETSIEVRARVLQGRAKGKDIVSQYVAFCRVFDEQVKEYGRTEQAVKSTIQTCSDRDVLAEYLEQRKKEVVDIMTQLYDQEREWKIYGKEERAEGRHEASVNNIKSLMKKMQMTAKQAMDILDIPASEQKKYIPLLK